MGVFDKVSLALVPDGIKDGKLYPIKPTDGSGDFIFSRGSNLAATRVDENGLIEKGRENLLLQSNQFDTTWVAGSNLTVTSGQSDRNGTNAAWLLSKSSSNRFIYQDLTSSGVQTYSVYIKAGTSSWVRLVANTSNFKGAYFDLSNGTTGYIENAIDATIESVGNGWYRCSVIFEGAVTRVRIYPAEQDSTDGTTGSIYIQDAQLEQGLVATDYIQTGATTAQAGILEDLPRIDYTGGTPSLLMEPSRTNSWIHSEYLDYSFSNVSNATITQNTTETLSPEGKYNAIKLEGVGGWTLRHAIVGTATGDWTVSCYIKAVNPGSNNTFRLSAGGNNFSSNLTATSEWQRFEFTISNGGNTNNGLLRDSSSNDSDLYIYGMQVEQASYPTSYIPTYGASATRGQETMGINTLNPTYSTDITLFLEVKRLISTNDINKEIGVLLNSTTTPINRVTFYSTSNGRLRVLISDNTGTTNNLYSAVNAFEKGETIKIALKITNSGCTLFIDGSSVDTSSGIGEILGINKISFIRDSIIKQYLIFPEALSDAECITLTT